MEFASRRFPPRVIQWLTTFSSATVQRASSIVCWKSTRVWQGARCVGVVVVAFFSCDKRTLSACFQNSSRKQASGSADSLADATFTIPTATLLTPFNVLPPKYASKTAFSSLVRFDESWTKVASMRLSQQ